MQFKQQQCNLILHENVNLAENGVYNINRIFGEKCIAILLIIFGVQNGKIVHFAYHWLHVYFLLLLLLNFCFDFVC